jgi:hypothetical protein
LRQKHIDEYNTVAETAFQLGFENAPYFRDYLKTVDYLY